MLEKSIHYLLDRHGSTLALTRLAFGAYDPATGAAPPGAVSTFLVRGVFINYSDDNIDGTTVRSGDRRLLVAAANAVTTPQIGDRVDNCQIIDVQTYAPNNTPVAWSCQVRK